MRSGLSERAGVGFERVQTKPMPSLEESPLQVAEVDTLVSGPDKSTYRTCRHAAGPLSRSSQTAVVRDCGPL